MNYTTVPNAALNALSQGLDEMTPQVRKAARYVMEHPEDIGFSTVREVAEAADVKPNTMVRMARQAGFDGFDDFREQFRDAIRSGEASFSDRARWLQGIQKGGAMGELFADMAERALKNIEKTFASTSEEQLQAAAEAIWNSRKVYTLGVGVNHANAHNFTYLASTGMTDFHTIPRPGSTSVDDLAWADEQDVLIAITCSPYRTEVVQAVQFAKEQGIKIVALSDSPASPIIRAADHGFLVSTETPQFFPSSAATIALLETLLSFVVAHSSEEVVGRVEKYHNRRHQLGLYQEDQN
ncbi:MurR/RpiR family transcriptional regulator [Cognatishimia activa]|uniref:MurR/RpiR family transcriptional regulator n=1 Tax=Cognatishimia activa TaxID=1715691 RepID=UPI0022323C0E|nr:MurR/RpiR family transcriptional regulator [Cognatishimia activa]